MDSRKEGWGAGESSSQCGLYMENVTQKMKYIQEIYAEKWTRTNVQRTARSVEASGNTGIRGRGAFSAIVGQLSVQHASRTTMHTECHIRNDIVFFFKYFIKIMFGNRGSEKRRQ